MHTYSTTTARAGLPFTLRSVLVATLALASIATTASAQPRYTLKDLGTLPGHANSTAYGINDRGDVVGASDADAFVWRNGVMVNLGRLAGGTFAGASSINSSGVIVGDGDTGNGRPQSWVTTASGLYNFFPNNGGNTHAVKISDSGAIGGYYTKSLSGNAASWRGSIWTPDPKDPRKYKQTDLPLLVGLDPKFKGTTALPFAFNQSGQAAGYAVNEVIGQHACFWKNDAAHSIIDLGVFPGDWSSVATGMNDFGQVAGESHPAFGSRPVVWNSDAAHTPIALPFPGADNYASATAINNLGHIIGWSAVSEPGTWNVGPSHTVVWRDGGVFDLQSSLDAASGAGWTITTVTAINNLGQIVGLGTFNGTSRAILLTPLQ